MRSAAGWLHPAKDRNFSWLQHEGERRTNCLTDSQITLLCSRLLARSLSCTKLLFFISLGFLARHASATGTEVKRDRKSRGKKWNKAAKRAKKK
jgi:hypothetical protein